MMAKERATCIFQHSSRPIWNCIDRKYNGANWVNPPVEFITKNSSNQTDYVGYHIKIVILVLTII